ncbi:receptor-like protein EIX1 [Bidens hawaiensis]|uniref:receptor-like protein EIX1 n=1 Tax=Bidens hawaiensis TaxID=980011 RepID=UPI0040493AE8
MANNICHKFLHLVLSLFLLRLKVTRAAPLGHKLLCIDKERHVLLHFKANIHHDIFGYLSTWKHEQDATNDCCSWDGVTCDNQTGHVTSLNLHGRLQGKISPSLLNLSYLNHLDLADNEFHGTIPSFIGSLTELKYLDLSYNSFHGTIPSFIGSLTKLRYLDLSYNSFHGTIPSEFGNITNLQDLSLGTLVGYSIENLDWLSRLSHLEKLDMAGVSLVKGSHWVNVIQSLHKLSYLNLMACDLTHVKHPYSSYANSSPSSSISRLDLGYNNLNSSMYRWLSQLTSHRLVDLDLSGNKLDGIPRYLGNLYGLTSLDFSYNDVAFKFSDFLYNLSGRTSDSLQALYAQDSQFIGPLSDDIQNFTSLVYLYLSDNLLNGTISEKVWELPKLQYFTVYSNSLKGALSENIGKSKLLILDLSNNSIEGVPSEDRMPNLSYIEYIDLWSCKLGPAFPKWIESLKNITYLDIANTGISDTMPVGFWNMWPSRLNSLDLSSNNITGKVTDLLSNFDSGPSNIILSSNNFYGSIEHVASGLSRLDLSRNKFYGDLSFLCQIIDGFLLFLDLSHNSFTGKIPDCLWHFKELRVLNLGQNNLSGRIPSSVEHLINLEVLTLYNNNFSGELPLSLRNCTMLTFLDLKGNTFYGYVPNWIGEKLSRLYVLSLASNNFFGAIPLQLCHLVKLQILDLSINNLYGTIPSCFNNLTAMVQGGLSPHHNVHVVYANHSFISEYVDSEMINWQGSVSEFRSTLGMVKSIDLSSNNLSGSIPYELTDLHGLISLNLSVNAFHDEIPPEIGLMKSLLQLDLSRNNLSGQIPTSMSQMTSLDYLDISCNKLSGRIPLSTQLQSFDPSTYTDNKGLCGPPLTKYCPGDKEFEIPRVVDQSESGGKGVGELERWFYIGGATGFATGFSIACGALLVNRRGSNVVFHFFGGLKDCAYVKVMVFVTKWQQAAHA